MRPNPGEQVEAAAARWSQRAVHQGQADQGQGRWAGQGGGAVSADRTAADGAGVAQKNLSNCDACELRKLVDHDHPDLSVIRQWAILGLPRSTLYNQPTAVRESTLWIMARIDAFYLEDACSISSRLLGYLARDGIPISRDPVRNLMLRMGLRAIYLKPRTTAPGTPSVRFPCLVDISTVMAMDQVWAADITYIQIQKGFVYLVAIMDHFSKTVLS